MWSRMYSSDPHESRLNEAARCAARRCRRLAFGGTLSTLWGDILQESRWPVNSE